VQALRQADKQPAISLGAAVPELPVGVVEGHGDIISGVDAAAKLLAKTPSIRRNLSLYILFILFLLSSSSSSFLSSRNNRIIEYLENKTLLSSVPTTPNTV
jgi:hypothetical protein